MKKLLLGLILCSVCVTAFAVKYDQACLNRLAAAGLLTDANMKRCEV
jgi:hypothetical protein